MLLLEKCILYEKMKPEDIDYLKNVYAKDKKNYLFHVEMVNSEIPLQYRSLEFDDLDHPQLKSSKEKVKSYLERLKKDGLHKLKGKGFYIFGSRGSAKTALACILAKEILRLYKYTVYFIPFLKLADILKNSDEKIIYTDYNFLIIDDFGDYQIQGFIADSLVSLIKLRYYQGNPTILTSVLDPQQVRSIFGNSLYSLMFECFVFLDHTKMIDWRKK